MTFLLVLLLGAGALALVGARRGRTVIDRTISINASPEAVFRHLEDADSIPRYVPGVSSVDEVRQTEQHIGDSFKVNYMVLGLKFPTRFLVTHYSQNSRILTQMEGPMAGTFDWSLRERTLGTDISVRVEYELRNGGVLGKAADGVLLRRVNEANVQRMLENLKQLVERQVTSG
jgi:carbon monoxide dehydrogenase subunit G